MAMNRIKNRSIWAFLLVLLAASLILVGCSNDAKKLIEAKDGYAEGRIGDTFKTYFFNYSVDSVQFVKEYEGVKAEEGYQFVDAVITIENTFKEEIPLYLSDFQIQWDIEESDYNYDFCLEIDSNTTLKDDYSLKRADTITKHFIFEIPDDAKKLSISYLELFDNDTEGDVFFTFFESK